MIGDSKYDSIAIDYSQTIDLINDLDSWIFKSNLPKVRHKILDIGCGTGSILAKLKSKFNQVYGLDPSRGMLSIARIKNPKGIFVQEGGTKLPYPDDYFDMVISHAVFHYMDRRLGLSEAKRVLKKSGKLVIAEVVKLHAINKLGEKIIFRKIITQLRLLWAHGISSTLRVWKFIYSDYWQQFANKNQNNLSSEEFREFYKQNLPGVKFGVANYRIHYLVWQKP
jgi:ubiquinone/menaquinone biosynthesis C-methylase UbiE